MAPSTDPPPKAAITSPKLAALLYVAFMYTGRITARRGEMRKLSAVAETKIARIGGSRNTKRNPSARS